MQDKRRLDRVLARLLSPRLGYLPLRWPEALYLHVREQALADGLSEADYLAWLLRTQDAAGLTVLLNAATIGHTAAYRHPEQFKQLGELLVGLAKTKAGPVNIWCAGCSTGEEAYSVAHAARSVGVDTTVLATDVNPVAIAVARSGHLPARCFVGAPVPPDWTQDVPAALRRHLRFEVASLTAAAPALDAGPFDIVFCRNVLIYFEREQVPTLISRLVTELVPGGYLVVAPVEVVLPLPPGVARGPAAGWLQRPREEDEAVASSRISSVPARAEVMVPPPVVLRRWRLAAGTPRQVEGEERQGSPGQRFPSIPPELLAQTSAVDEAARLLSAGRTKEAEEALSSLLNVDPEQLAAWFLLGEALQARGARMQARAAFLRASRCATGTMPEIDEEALRRTAIRRADAL